jgi:cytochrome P450
MANSKLPKRYGWNTPVTAPGPKGLSMVSMMKNIMAEPLPFLAAMRLQFGDVVQFPIPKPATYFVSSPEGARDVLVAKHKQVNKRTIQYSTLALVTGEGLLTADGEVWKQRRRILQPAFHHEMIKLTQDQVVSALSALNKRWHESLSAGEEIFDVDQEMMSLALEITGNTLFGTDLSGEALEITSATISALHGVVARAKNPLALPLKVPTPANQGMNKAIARLDQSIERIVKYRNQDRLPMGSPIRDMLDVLLAAEDENQINKTQLRDEVATFIVAGHETVASALTWALHLLATHQDEQEALAKNPEKSEQVFAETLRLYPPAWLITRRTLEDIHVNETLIPANSLVILSPWVTHRHESIWEKPMEFNSDRMNDGTPQVGYFPFGAGPRLCIGKDMALLEGKLILADLFQNWKVSPLTHAPVPVDASVTLRPKHGLPMRITAR